MKLVMTLLVRNEADIVGDHLAFHLATGVDFVLAADNGSSDGTSEILERYASEGKLHRIELPDPFSQVEVVTRMARLAATDFGADWVINSDADEFWWPRSGTLKEILAAVPRRYGSVRGMWRNFAPRAESAGAFAERMTVRSQRPVDDLHPFNTHSKAIHRAAPDVEVGGGNHDAIGRGLAPLYAWYPVDVLHFPIRAFEQFERKFMRWWQITSVDGEATNPFYNRVRDEHREGRLRELYESFVVDDADVARGLVDGTLVEDTRLRDALRSLRLEAPQLELRASDVDPGYLVELGYLEDHTPFARAQRRLDALEERLVSVEKGLPARLSRRLTATR